MPPKVLAPLAPANLRSGLNNYSKQPETSSTSPSTNKSTIPANTTTSITTTAAAFQPVKNSIVVSARQRGNPIIPHIRNVQWEYGDVVPDYVVGLQTGLLYLSLRYHRLHPEYLHQRIEKLGNMYALRILLIMCDVNDHQDPIREITKICIINNLTVVIAWTPEEAGQYIATYKLYETKPPTILQERTSKDYASHLNKALTAVRGVNRTDVLTLSSSFGAFSKMVHASREEISLCPGLGDVKVRRLVEAFTAPLRGSSINKRKGVDQPVDLQGTRQKRRETDSGESNLKDNGESTKVGQNEVEEETERDPSPDWPSEDGQDPELEDAESTRSTSWSASPPLSNKPEDSALTSRAESPDWPDDEEVEILKDVLAKGPL